MFRKLTRSEHLATRGVRPPPVLPGSSLVPGCKQVHSWAGHSAKRPKPRQDRLQRWKYPLGLCEVGGIGLRVSATNCLRGAEDAVVLRDGDHGQMVTQEASSQAQAPVSLLILIL